MTKFSCLNRRRGTIQDWWYHSAIWIFKIPSWQPCAEHFM